MPAPYRILILVANEPAALERLQQYSVATYCEFITTGQRQQLIIGTLSIEELKQIHPGQAEYIDAQADCLQSRWANAATPTVVSWILMNVDLTQVQWGRTQGWLAETQNDRWMRLMWAGVGDNELQYDECGSAMTNMPPEGTDTLPGDGYQLLLDAGYTNWVPEGGMD